MQRFITSLVLLNILFISPILSLSDHATHILAHLSGISSALEAGQDAGNGYYGGLLAAIPSGQRTMDVWAALRQANEEIQSNPLSEEDSTAVVESLASTHTLSIAVMEMMVEKEPHFRAAKVHFLVPIALDAFYKEVDDLLTTLAKQVSPGHRHTVQRVGAEFTQAWEKVFAASMANTDGTAGSWINYLPFFDTVQPILGRLL
ncbi:hypothetical protein FE257_003074 [Aspergillus nanangensis]|uniref:Uncharacterized protein n=1 Tax=Aspergillus nanangensis TaxID=2582783 RepID=A0AAD4GNS1_ASPNN|nr:hypothetical protein FE257_003074 [Aspergillus nanangensis]